MPYRFVLGFDKRQKSGFNRRRTYTHWFLVRLSCGHSETAKPVRGGKCPRTVNCRYCKRHYTHGIFHEPAPAVLETRPRLPTQGRAEGMDWVWEGILARGRITVLTAQAKAGKTTLLSLLLRDMAKGGHLLGCRVNPGRVIVVSEECEETWTHRRDYLGIDDHAEFICLPFFTKPTMDQWLDLLRQGFSDVKQRQVELVVFDTLSHLWPVKDENDNGQMQQALMPLRYISEQGPAVLPIHHAGGPASGPEAAPRLKGSATN